MEAIDTFEHWGIPVELHQDTDAGDPYTDMDQASELLCFDRLYREYGFGGRFPRDEERELAVLARWLTVFGGYAVAIPFRFDDYGSSGARARLVGIDSDRAAGFVVVRREKVTEEWPEETTIDGETFTALEMAERCARGEFETWAAWVAGDVYGYVVAPGSPEEDSCWGFYGPGVEYVRQEARSMAEQAAFDREKRRLTERMYLLDPDANPHTLSWGVFRAEREGVPAGGAEPRHGQGADGNQPAVSAHAPHRVGVGAFNTTTEAGANLTGETRARLREGA